MTRATALRRIARAQAALTKAEDEIAQRRLDGKPIPALLYDKLNIAQCRLAIFKRDLDDPPSPDAD